MKGRGRARTGIVEGRARGRVGLKAHAGGRVGFIMERPARIRVRLRMPPVIVSGPDGREIRMTSPRELSILGKAVKPHAHMLASVILLLAAANPRRRAGELVSVPLDLLNMVACLLLALPRPRRGRPRMASTNRALELAVQHTMRGATQLIAKSTGENPENIRARVLGIKRRARKGGNKFG
jgi:hypothetical protein